MITEDYWILYQFSYRMVGNILKERDGKAPDLGKVEVRCCHEPYPYGAPGFPEPHFDLEFWVRLPRAYKYSDIAEFLIHGREIDFVYNGRECAITNHTNRWWFYDGVDQVGVCVVSKVAEYTVDDRLVQDIFDDGLYEKISIL